MKLLADENFPRSVVDALRHDGIDVVWVRQQMPSAKDEDILSYAIAESRVLVTFDKDFGELAFRRGLPSTCGIVLFRIAIISRDSIAAQIVTILKSRIDWAGQFAVVDETRIRMRTLPNRMHGE